MPKPLHALSKPSPRAVPLDTARLDRLCQAYKEQKAAENEAHEAASKTSERIAAMLTAAGLDASETDDYKVTVVTMERETLDKTILASLGVKPSIIRKATKITPVSYPRITDKAEAEEKAQAKQDGR